MSVTRVCQAGDGLQPIGSQLAGWAGGRGMIGAMDDRPYPVTDRRSDTADYTSARGSTYTVVYTQPKEASRW